jgi:hypothetical protein
MLQVYGWASWSPKKAILVLRNPSEQVSLDVAQAFEIPAGEPAKFDAKSPWGKDGSEPTVRVRAGAAHKFLLAPFEVPTLEAVPVNK